MAQLHHSTVRYAPTREDESRFEEGIVRALNAPSDPNDPYDTPGHRHERAIRDAILQGSAWAFGGGCDDQQRIVHALRIVLRHIPSSGVNAPGRNHDPAWLAALDHTWTHHPWERSIDAILQTLRDAGASIEDHAVERSWEGGTPRVPAIRRILDEERARRFDRDHAFA